jgi:magnesium-protoporphyrin IX monomethyl ester (oxidative) cyclase
MLIRSDPALLRGANKLWIKFFLLSVYVTMFVRDHTRPAFHAALGFDPTDYDYRVFRICSDISKQVFPLMLDTDNPLFRARMARLKSFADGLVEAKSQGGLMGALRRLRLKASIAVSFIGLYLMRTEANETPETVRLSPAW